MFQIKRNGYVSDYSKVWLSASIMLLIVGTEEAVDCATIILIVHVELVSMASQWLLVPPIN